MLIHMRNKTALLSVFVCQFEIARTSCAIEVRSILIVLVYSSAGESAKQSSRSDIQQTYRLLECCFMFSLLHFLFNFIIFFCELLVCLFKNALLVYHYFHEHFLVSSIFPFEQTGK